MTERRGRRVPDEEPIIGVDDFDVDEYEDEFTDDLDDGYVIGGSGRSPAEPAGVARGRPIPAPPVEDDFDDGEFYEDDDYDFYDGDVPARQPLFYVFLALAVLVGGLIVFLLISIASRGDDDEGGGDPQPADIELSVDAPATGDYVEVGKDVEVVVRAKATEAVVRFELYRGTNVVDRVNATAPDPDDVYAAILKMRFDTKGEFPFFVRVVTESGAHRDSKEIKLVVTQPVSGQPPAVKGRALALVTLRLGPGDEFAAAGQLQPQEEVEILGKTKTVEWLLVNRGGGLWVRRTAIQESDSLALVQVREPTPTPRPATATPVQTASPTGSPSPSVSPTATVPANAPDFIPANATLVEGGSKLRVTVANIAPNAYAGPLVVSVGDIGAGGTLARVFNVTIPANGSTVVEFDLNPPVTTQKTARVTIDPDLAIAESNEDNNGASFGLAPPSDPPEIIILDPVIGATSVDVTLRNDGGPLASSSVTVRIKMDSGGQAADSTRDVALASGQTSPTFTVLKPGTGAATIQVLVNGQVVASANIQLP